MSTTSASGWTSQQTALLINRYQNEEVLYHVKSAEYHNKFARQSALDRIVAVLSTNKAGLTVAQVKAKINVLRSRYTAELGKIRYEHSGQGAEENHKVTFEFFEQMKFLSDHVQARKGTLNQSLPAADVSITEGDLGTESQDGHYSGNWLENLEATEHEITNKTASFIIFYLFKLRYKYV